MELIEVTVSNVDVLSLLERIKLIVCYLIVKVFINEFVQLEVGKAFLSGGIRKCPRNTILTSEEINDSFDSNLAAALMLTTHT